MPHKNRAQVETMAPKFLEPRFKKVWADLFEIGQSLEVDPVNDGFVLPESLGDGRALPAKSDINSLASIEAISVDPETGKIKLYPDTAEAGGVVEPGTVRTSGERAVSRPRHFAAAA